MSMTATAFTELDCYLSEKVCTSSLEDLEREMFWNVLNEEVMKEINREVVRQIHDLSIRTD